MVWTQLMGKRSIFHFKSHSEHFIKSEFPIHFHGKNVRFRRKSKIPSNKSKSTQLMVWATFKGKRSIFHFKSHSEHFIKSEFSIHFHGKTSDFVEKVKFLEISQNRLNSWFGQLLRGNGAYSISKAILNISSNPSSRFIFMAKRQIS